MAGIVIIGSGECGVRAAFALRELGFDGPVTLLGDEASLPYERPPLSKDLDAAPKPIRVSEAYDEAQIKRMYGVTVARIDPVNRSVTTADGESLDYDDLLLATGARARLFPGMEGCLTLRTDKDAATIAGQLTANARVGIIGGGFIGLELAATARQRGAHVTVFEAGPRILGRAIPRDIADVVYRRHEAEGVEIKTDAGVAGADAQSITFANGMVRAFDVIIAGVGALPNTDLAEAAGLVIENGIVVDGNFRTLDPHIFAAGDCCTFEWRGERVRLESWKAAQDQGSHVASAILGVSDTYSKVPWFWSDQYDLSLQVAGIFDQSRPILQRASEHESTIVFQIDAADRLKAAAGIGPGNSVAKDIRIFEKLMERGASVNPQVLADPSQNLKRLLKAA